MTKTISVSTAIQSTARTDPGRSGKNNEDCYAIFEADAPGDASAARLTVAVVADGIGGNKAGEKASLMAVDMLRMVLTRDRQLPVRERLECAVAAANSEVYNASLDRPEFAGMGTTVVVAVISDDSLFIVHAGDSRAYLFRDGALHRLTVDHTWAQEAIEAGYLTPERARTHPNRNVIKRYLGIEESALVDHSIVDINLPADPDNPYAPRPTVDTLTLHPSDTLLLCSDGLTDELQDDEIAATLGRLAPERAAARLVDQANAKGGRDNITVALLRIGKQGALAAGQPATPSAASAKSVGRLPRKWLLAAAGLLLLALTGGATVWALTGGAAAWALSHRTAAPVTAVSPPPLTAAVSPPPLTGTAVLDTPEPTSTPMVAAETQAAPTGTPGSTAALVLEPTSTPIPGVTSSATPTNRRPTATPRVGGSMAESRTTPTGSQVGSIIASLESPPNEELLKDPVVFVIKVNRTPPANQGLELVFWRPGEDPLKDGFGPVGSFREAQGEFKIDPDVLDRDPNLGARFKPGEYLWGVRLIQLSPYRPLELVSEQRHFRFERRQSVENTPVPPKPELPPPIP